MPGTVYVYRVGNGADLISTQGTYFRHRLESISGCKVFTAYGRYGGQRTGNRAMGSFHRCCKTVYSFDYGYAHIAVLNTECSGDDLNKEGDWLKSDMEKSDKPWKIVALHRGPYGATYDSAEVRNALAPVFDEAGIDLVLQGHDHNYVRTYPMNNKAEVTAGKGTVYITANSGGVKFYPKKWRSWQAVDLQPYIQMFVAVTVNKSTLKIQAYDVNNTLRDTLTLKK